MKCCKAKHCNKWRTHLMGLLLDWTWLGKESELENVNREGERGRDLHQAHCPFSYHYFFLHSTPSWKSHTHSLLLLLHFLSIPQPIAVWFHFLHFTEIETVFNKFIYNLIVGKSSGYFTIFISCEHLQHLTLVTTPFWKLSAPLASVTSLSFWLFPYLYGNSFQSSSGASLLPFSLYTLVLLRTLSLGF